MPYRRGYRTFHKRSIQRYRRQRRRKPYMSRTWTRNVFKGKEMKFLDTAVTAKPFSTAWAPMEDATSNTLNGIPQSDSESGRDGRIAWIHSVHMKYFLLVGLAESQTSPSADFLARIAIVIDRQANGTGITSSDVYDEGQTDDVIAYRNLREISRFRVVYDKTTRVSLSDMNEGSPDLFAHGIWVSPVFKVNQTFNPPLKVHYGGSGSTVGAISDIALHCIGIATSTTITLQAQWRVRFTG